MNPRDPDDVGAPEVGRCQGRRDALSTLGHKSHANAVTKGFYADYERVRSRLGSAQDRAFLDNLWRLARLALVHSEISEAVEAIRDGSVSGTTVNGKPEGLPAELADAVIRIAGFAAHQGIDLDKAIRDKSAYNETRPQGHGRTSKL